MTQNNVIVKGPGVFKIAWGVFFGLCLFTAFMATLVSILFTLGVLNLAGLL